MQLEKLQDQKPECHLEWPYKNALFRWATPNETVVSCPTRASCFSYLIDSHYMAIISLIINEILKLLFSCSLLPLSTWLAEFLWLIN